MVRGACGARLIRVFGFLDEIGNLVAIEWHEDNTVNCHFFPPAPPAAIGRWLDRAPPPAIMS